MAKFKNTEKIDKKKIKKDKKFKTKHYPCSYCSKTFPERAGRDHHLQLHSSERPFSCNLCPHTCKTKKYLAKHVRMVHKPPTSFKCEYCAKMFHYKCILDKHIVVHTNSKPHKCKECGKGFNSQYSLKSHVLIHTNLKPFKCKFCEYACRDSSTLRRHHERHMGVVKRYDCSICDKRFSKKQLLQYHVAEIHMNVNTKKIPCNQCNGMFRTKKLLSIHIEVRHNRKFATTCEICGLKLANKYNMNTHLMSHVNVRPYKCSFSGCDKRYKDRSSLQKHSIIHYPEKQFPCKICGKMFTRKERLRKHKKQHMARIKNVQCDYCGVCFYNKNYLKVHIRKKHSRRKIKFICDMCDFESGNKPGLIKHIKGHDMRMDKQCPICTKQYKQENWLKLHLWHTHKIMEYNGIPTFETDIKVEPIDVDVDGAPEFELFEIEKEEILDDLQSFSTDTFSEQNKAIEAIREKCDEIEEDENNGLTKEYESLKNHNDILPCKESFETSPVDTYDVQVADNSRDVQTDNDVTDTQNFENKKYLMQNVEKDVPKFNGNQINNNEELDDSNTILAEECHYMDSQDFIKPIKQVPCAQNEHYSQAMSSKDTNKRLHNLKYVQLKNPISGSLKGKSLAQIKAKLEVQKLLQKSKPSGNLNKKPSNSKQKNLADIKALLIKKQLENNKEMCSENLSETEELEGIEYSKAVFSEDITRCMTQGKKKDSSEKNFDDFLIEHIVERQEQPSKEVLQVDKGCHSYAKKCVNTLLKKKRNYNEVKLIEKTRQQYNERIRNARKLRPEKVSIKYFDKINQNNGIIINNQKEKDNSSQVRQNYINNKGEKDNDLETDRNKMKNDDKDVMENKCKKTDNVPNDSDNPIEIKDANINHDDDHIIKTQSYTSSDIKFDGDNELSYNIDSTLHDKQEEKTNRVRLRSGSIKGLESGLVPDNTMIKNVEECRKIKLNTHQCYVCFKLFNSKEKLLDHCKDHFEVCNSTILKKCPLCDFATKSNIVQHMKVEHNVEITIPSTRIIDKESENGPRYCYKVDSTLITDIDVIPSVKHLNKQAYIAIDKKNRKLKDTGIAKTKLVKKGNEWIVERKTTKIDNVDEFILPEFDVDEILAVKIDSNDYLSRMKKLYRLAKKHKKNMLFPCENCEKICHTLSALKLHYRRHDPKSKPFKKKIWKHKMKDFIQPTNKKVTDVDYGKKKYSRVAEIDKKGPLDKNINDNRYKKPKPVVNKHKCDPELIKFYENNIKGGDVEFWQFLKIFNKLSRENVNDFDDLNERPEFGIHKDETNANNRVEGNAGVNYNEKEQNVNVSQKTCNRKNIKNGAIRRPKIANRNKFKRIIRISRREHLRRNDLKQKLRDKIAEENIKT